MIPSSKRKLPPHLFDSGVQVVFTGADTPAAGDVAQEKGKWGVNYDWVGACKVERCLTAPYWNWGPIYAGIAEGVIAGTYTPGFDYFDADTGALGLYGFMEGQTPQPGFDDLPAEDQKLIKDTLAAVLAGDVHPLRCFQRTRSLTTKEMRFCLTGFQLEQIDLDGFQQFGSPCR